MGKIDPSSCLSLMLLKNEEGQCVGVPLEMVVSALIRN